MFHRQAEVKFRGGDQENRVGGFPKTPKHAGTQESRFVTPAPKMRVALGAKSTNVHHRQFASAKTGKRHSPVAAPKLSFAAVEPEPVLRELEGAAALRAALQRALATGVDVPDVEYAPPPVEELPYSEPEGLEPMDWDALHYLQSQGAFAPRRLQIKTDEPVDVLRPFEFIDPEAQNRGKRMPSTVPKGSRLPSSGTKSAVPARLGGFAAPTAAARARSKTAQSSSDKENRTTSSSFTSTTTTRARPTTRPLTLSRSSSSNTANSSIRVPLVDKHGARLKPLRSVSSRTAGSVDVDDSAHVPDALEPLPIMEVEFDIDDE